MDRVYEFSSEAVTAGHPDKIADQVSDAILDAHVQLNRNAKTAVEVFIPRADRVIIGGEINTPHDAQVDIEEVVRQTLKTIGYDALWKGCDYHQIQIINHLRRQSVDIQNGIKEGGAGDQGIMFGYATRESAELMPLPLLFARQLAQKYSKLIREDEQLLLGPDAKTQVTIQYRNGQPEFVTRVLVSAQHHPDYSLDEVRDTVLRKVVEPVIPKAHRADNLVIQINPGGEFHVGGPAADTGLTGRKIIADTYGGMAPHGGGAFSGKDPSKVDRSAALMARYIARHLVNRGYCERCTVQLAYAFGQAEPESLYLDFHKTGKLSESEAEQLVRREYDLSPRGMIDYLDLKRPMYEDCARNGHFGRNLQNLTWEQ